MKKTVLIAAFLLMLCVINVSATAPVGWRILPEVLAFDTVEPSGWAGGGSSEIELNAAGSFLPFDTTVTYNGKPSLRVNITKTAYWWMALITVRGWCTHDLSQYYANGFLEFNIKGNAGGEVFELGMRDRVYERTINGTLTQNVDVVKLSSAYMTLTTAWQHVKIPLKDLMDPSAGYTSRQSFCFILKNNNSYLNPMEFWINEIKFTSPDNEAGFPATKVNQVGYLVNAEKYALVTGFEDELTAVAGTQFIVKRASDSVVVYTGALTLLSDYDASDSGERIFKADFSSLSTAGTYFISVAATGIADSPQFAITNTLYTSLLKDSARYFYYQRANLALASPYITDYPRADKTPQDSSARFDSYQNPARSVLKGWYDAGDYGKYINAGSTGISDMFWAYELFPGQFTDNQFNIPESGNGIPDILDEARYELEWILTMQDAASGGFYARVQSNDDMNITERIIKDKTDTTVNIRSTDDTACAAAILSHASIIYATIDATFATTCKNAAISAWTFLVNNPTNIVSPSGPYNVTDDTGDRLWAAASLFRATGTAAYNTYFLNNYASFASFFTADDYGHFVGKMTPFAFFNYLKASGADATAVSWFGTQFAAWRTNKISRYLANPWLNCVKPGNYFWGINMQVINVPMDVIIGTKLLNTYSADDSKFMRAGLNWLLGANPIRRSMVSGYGSDAITTVYSNLYSFDQKIGIPKGYMPGGPNSYEGKGISKFPAKCITNTDCDWVSNEHTVYWNSALIFAAAFIQADVGTTPTATATATTITRTATRTATTITRTATATRTATTRTATPTRTSTTITRTATATGTPTRTATSTSVATRTATATATPTGPISCSCAIGCSTATSITPNYAKDGVGQVCLTAASLGSYINSWNLVTLNVNGVDCTNKYVAAASLPAKINGLYYVYYDSTVAWGHFEAVN